ncbi:MAG: hypothetical protein V4719_21510 [Planctomycetota bacterium]
MSVSLVKTLHTIGTGMSDHAGLSFSQPQSQMYGLAGRWVLWIAASLVGSATLLLPSPVSAGQESTGRDQDIVLQVDSRWPGNAYGGYFPLRVKLSNMGAPRDLTLVYEAMDNRRSEAIPRVHRTVHVEQQATVNVTLSVPVVSSGTDGIFRVLAENGEELEGLRSRHALPVFGGAQPRTSLLVISTDNLDDKQLQPFEDAAATECASLLGIGGAASRGYYPNNQIVERDHVVVQPTQNLPVNWIDYSGVDLVAVNWPDWNSRLTVAERDAILKWTATGGVLLIYGTGKPAASLEELNRALQVDREALAGWMACQPEKHHVIDIISAEVLRTGGVGLPAVLPPGAVTAPPKVKSDDSGKWNVDAETFSYRDWELGTIYVFPNSPFPGNASNWSWWLSSLPRNLSQWPRKFGMSARSSNSEFLTFLIPGVGSVPVFAFLFLITIFTIIIGPLNYYWLYKRRRLAVMVLTVPLIAGVTCTLLFAYSLIADGFSIRSRMHSFTWLNQQRKSAVSLSLYAPFAPSAGLRFSPECAVFPIWPHSSGFESGSVDWSANDQRLSSSWFRSQTWTQFLTVENRDERGRLDFTPPTNPQAPVLAVSNGLSWDLEYLAVKVTDSQWYAGGPVPAGATAELKLVERSDVATRFNQASEQAAWKLPDGMLQNPQVWTPYSMRGRYGMHQSLDTTFAQGLLSRYSAEAASLERGPRREFYDWREGSNTSEKRSEAVAQKPLYWAISRRNPGIQTGVKTAIDSNSLHLVLGTF